MESSHFLDFVRHEVLRKHPSFMTWDKARQHRHILEFFEEKKLSNTQHEADVLRHFNMYHASAQTSDAKTCDTKRQELSKEWLARELAAVMDFGPPCISDIIAEYMVSPPRPLRNLGCTDYINVVLQLLARVPSFCDRFTALTDENFASTPALKELKHVLSEMTSLEHENKVIDPRKFTSELKNEFGDRLDLSQQSDAASFLQRLLADMQANPFVKPLVADTFLATLGTYVYGCDTCTGASTRENFRSEHVSMAQISIKDQAELHDALELFVAPENISGVCQECDGKVDIMKCTVFHELPSTLLLQQQRFEMNYTTFAIEKNHSSVSIPRTLDMTPYTTARVPHLEDEKKGQVDCTYALQGAICHAGHSHSGYVSLVWYDPFGEAWYEICDHMFHTLTERQAMERINGQVSRSCGYVLVYRKI